MLLVVLFAIPAAAQDFNGKWVLLERDSLGYLVYKPCNGSRDAYFLLKDKEIEFNWWMDGVERSFITNRAFFEDRCTIIADSSYWEEDGSNKKRMNPQKWEIEIVDEKRQLVIIRMYHPKETLGKYAFSWMAMPEEYAKKLRVINCDEYWKEKKGKGYQISRYPELKFLPVEYP